MCNLAFKLFLTQTHKIKLNESRDCMHGIPVGNVFFECTRFLDLPQVDFGTRQFLFLDVSNFL